MRIEVKFFAVLRDVAGVSDLWLDLEWKASLILVSALVIRVFTLPSLIMPA
jgi:molybdopterin converting factor small subunit